MKSIKRRKGKEAYDAGSVDSHSYNDESGARKVIPVGHKLSPLGDGTTVANTRKKVGQGKIIAVYNNLGTVGVITVGDVTVTSGAVGSVASGFVRIPCKANDWTYINTYDQEYIVTDAATTLCFLVEDHTYLDNRGV